MSFDIIRKDKQFGIKFGDIRSEISANWSKYRTNSNKTDNQEKYCISKMQKKSNKRNPKQ